MASTQRISRSDLHSAFCRNKWICFHSSTDQLDSKSSSSLPEYARRGGGQSLFLITPSSTSCNARLRTLSVERILGCPTAKMSAHLPHMPQPCFLSEETRRSVSALENLPPLAGRPSLVEIRPWFAGVRSFLAPPGSLSSLMSLSSSVLFPSSSATGPRRD